MLSTGRSTSSWMSEVVSTMGLEDVPLSISQIFEHFQEEGIFFPEFCLLLLLPISPQMSDQLLDSKFLCPSNFCAEGFCLQTLAWCHSKPSTPKEKGGLQRAENRRHEWAGAGIVVVLREGAAVILSGIWGVTDHFHPHKNFFRSRFNPLSGPFSCSC